MSTARILACSTFVLAGALLAHQDARGDEAVPALPEPPLRVAALLAKSDEAYQQRGRDVDANRRVDPGPIREAIRAAEEALDAQPDSLEARYRLVRGLYFAGDHSNEDEESRLRDLERCEGVGDIGMDQLAVALGGGERLEELEPAEIRNRVPPQDRPSVAALYYWTSLCWGSASQLTGTFRAIRDGVANILYEMSGVVLALDPGHHIGGAHRLRAYLHATLPSVPFITGWVDRDKSVPEAESAMAFASDERENRVIYGLALWETRPEERGRAETILRDVARLEPRPEHRAEDLSIQALALETVGDLPKRKS